MINNPFYTSEEFQGKYEMFDVGDIDLAHNKLTLRNCKLAYRTFGKLNEAKDNAILILTWFSGTGKGMQDAFVGSGRAVDPDKYFVIIIDQIGSGTSTSPHNTPPPQGMADFPKISIADDVCAQHKLITTKYGITELACVLGGSMGGMQTYEWAVRYPDMVNRAAMIAAPAKTPIHQRTFTETLEKALKSDPLFKSGWYASNVDVRNGLVLLAREVTPLAWSTEFFQEELWRSSMGVSSREEFIELVMCAGYELMDPNALLVQMWKWRNADISQHAGGDLRAALGKIKAKCYIMAISHDMFFPTHELKTDQEMIPGSKYCEIQSKFGHSALEGSDASYVEQMDNYLNELLST